MPSDPHTANALLALDDLAKRYADARTVLAERVNALEYEVAELQRRRLGGIKSAASAAAQLQAELRAAIETCSFLFVKPRTLVLHGVTVGFRKGAGSLDWDDNAKVVALIRKHLPEQADVLVLTEEKPSADALKNLDARELARIGVRMEGIEDQVVVKSADSAVDKLVKRILAEGAKAAVAVE